jgi:hypothetical protein
MDVRWTFFGDLAFVSTRTEQEILYEWRSGELTAKSIVTTKNTEGTEFLDKKVLWTIGLAMHL